MLSLADPTSSFKTWMFLVIITVFLFVAQSHGMRDKQDDPQQTRSPSELSADREEYVKGLQDNRKRKHPAAESEPELPDPKRTKNVERASKSQELNENTGISLEERPEEDQTKQACPLKPSSRPNLKLISIATIPGERYGFAVLDNPAASDVSLGVNPSVVHKVYKGTLADEAGLLVGHLIYTINGEDVSRLGQDDVDSHIRRVRSSEGTLEFGVARAWWVPRRFALESSEFEVTNDFVIHLMVVTKRETLGAGDRGSGFDLEKSKICVGTDRPVYVSNVAPNGRAEKGGVRKHDVFLRVNQQSTQDLTPLDVISIMKSSPTTNIFLLRNRKNEPDAKCQAQGRRRRSANPLPLQHATARLRQAAMASRALPSSDSFSSEDSRAVGRYALHSSTGSRSPQHRVIFEQTEGQKILIDSE